MSKAEISKAEMPKAEMSEKSEAKMSEAEMSDMPKAEMSEMSADRGGRTTPTASAKRRDKLGKVYNHSFTQFILQPTSPSNSGSGVYGSNV